MNAEQLAREITGDLFASASDKEGVLLCLIVNGRQTGGYCRDSVEQIIAARIKPLVEDAERWRALQSRTEREANLGECKRNPVPGKGCVRPSPHEVARGANGCIWCGKKFQ